MTSMSARCARAAAINTSPTGPATDSMKIDLDADSVPNRLARKISQSIAQRPMAFFSASEKDLLCIDLERHRSGNRTRRRRCFLPTTHNSAENDAWRLRRRNQNRPTATENIL